MAEDAGGLPGFISMPNFRQVDDNGRIGKERSRKLKLYRSSRPDFLTEGEIDQFRELKIKSIIDLRSVKEYATANGRKALDRLYPPYKIKLPLNNKIKPGESVKYIPVNKSKKRDYNQPLDLAADSSNVTNRCNGDQLNVQQQAYGKHFLINFFKINYIWTIYNRAPWYQKLYSLIFLVFDIIFNTHYKHFVRFFARNVLNKNGLAGQYIDMINHSQAQICAALKLLADPENVPAMLNCAHGKDRTGVVSALVLSVFDTSKENIAEDYARSEGELEQIQQRIREEMVEKYHMSENFLTAKAETMMEVLNHIEEQYGSLTNYLEAIGFGLEDQKRLRQNLLE